MAHYFLASGRGLGNGNLIPEIQIRYQKWVTNITTVFGFVHMHSRLYGGRFDKGISYSQVQQLRNSGISFDLNLTNHFFDEDAWAETIPILQQIHQTGNGVVCTNDEVAKRIKQDFPDLTVRASMIKMINTHEKINESLQLYDYITLPMFIRDPQFLSEIQQKDKIILFANAFCAYTCKEFSCYRVISHEHFTGYKKDRSEHQQRACQNNCNRAQYIEFDLSDPRYNGFSHFKLIPLR